MKLFSRFRKSKKPECEMINLLDIDGITFKDYFKVKQVDLTKQLEINMDELDKYYNKCDKKTKYDRIVLAIIDNGNLMLLPIKEEIQQIRTVYMNNRANLSDVTEFAKHILTNYYYCPYFWKYLTDIIPIRFNHKLFNNLELYNEFENTLVYVFSKVNFDITVKKNHESIPVWSPTDNYNLNDYSLLVNVILFSLRTAYYSYEDYYKTMVKI